jgi:hypothetical protein
MAGNVGLGWLKRLGRLRHNTGNFGFLSGSEPRKRAWVKVMNADRASTDLTPVRQRSLQARACEAYLNVGVRYL